MDIMKITILYGSQTGTAQEVAERIWRDSRRYHLTGSVMEMNKFAVKCLPSEQLIVFVCSTTGQGEEPNNMKIFWKYLLKRSHSSTFLSATKFAVLGLGDSSYAKFGFAAKRLHKRLMQLGGQPILELAIGDDQHDLGADFVIGSWMPLLWSTVRQLFPRLSHLKPLDITDISPPKYIVTISQEERMDVNERKTSEYEFPWFATLSQNTRITSESHFQDVRIIKLSSSKLMYRPGEVLVVQPQNSMSNVNKFLQLFNIDKDTVINIEHVDDEYAFELPAQWILTSPCTIQECAQRFLDLQAIPHLYALQILASFTSSELEKEKLLEFCSAEGREEFYNYCSRPRRGILELLEDFPHATAALPLKYLFDVFKPIRPRSFSIASAMEKCHGTCEILVAVVNYRSKLKAPRLGLCSNWLANLSPGDTVPCWVQSGSFRFPTSTDVPLIMVGPGTGCAPFRSLIQQRDTYKEPGTLVLFLGFRNRSGDFHCQSEWESYVASGSLTLICAFSRDQENKIYVQHKILENAKMVWNLLYNHNAYFFVAGNSKNMPNSVREAIIDIACQVQGYSKGDSEMYVEKLEKCGRYQTETWS